MSELNNFNNQYITSACISGPIIDGIKIGPCVNDEYNNNILKEYKLENMRFDVAYDIEERKEEYSDYELDSIYNNPSIREAEDQYYENDLRNSLNSYWKSLAEDEEQLYFDMMAKEEEERMKFLQEEEEEAIRYERFIGIVSRRR